MGINFYSDIEGNGNDLSNWTGGGGGSGGGASTLLLGLGAWWKLDEVSGDRGDSSGNGWTLTDNNTVTSQAGLLGNEAVFVAANTESLTRPSAGEDYPFKNDQSFSFSGWVTFDTVSAVFLIASVFTGTGDQRKWQVFLDATNVLRFVTNSDGTGGSNDLLDSVATYTTGTRYHVVVTYDSPTNAKAIYVDGTLEASSTASHPNGLHICTESFALGAQSTTTPAFHLDGKLDECAYWSRALTSDEVSELYNSGVGITFEDLASGSGSGGSGGGTTTGARVTKSGNQTIPNNTSTVLTFDQEDYDTENYHDNVTNNSRLTIPEDGFYVVTGNVEWTTNTTGNRSLTLRVNGSTIIGNIKQTPPNTDPRYSITTSYEFSAGDYVELFAAQTSGGNLDVEATVTTSFSIVKVPGGGSGESGGGGSTTGVSAISTAIQTLADDVQTILDISDTIEYDTENYFDAGSPTKVTIPEDGFYIISAQVNFAPNATGFRFIQFYLNGSPSLALHQHPVSDGTELTIINLDTTYQFTAGDELEISARQNSGGNLDVNFARLRVAKIPGGGSGSGGPAEITRLTKSAPQTLATGTLTNITFDGEDYDDEGLHDNVTNPERLTIVEDGTYYLLGQIEYAANVTGERTLEFQLNGTSRLAVNRGPAAPTSETRIQVSGTFKLTAGDFVTLRAQQNTGGNLDVLAGNSLLSAVRLEAGGGGSGGGRELLTANRTYYVATTGSDSNDGLTVGNPFLTIQKAVDVASSLDLGIYDVDIQLADGTYNIATTIQLKTIVGSGQVFIKGNNGTPANVVLNGSVDVIRGCYTGDYKLQDFTIQTSSGNCIYIFGCKASTVRIENLRFGTCTSVHMALEDGPIGFVEGDYEIFGDATYHLYAIAHSSWNYTRGGGVRTITLTGTPNFSGAFAICSRLGLMVFTTGNCVFSGSATGSRYNVSKGAILDTNGAGASYLPGNASGTTSDNGLYL